MNSIFHPAHQPPVLTPSNGSTPCPDPALRDERIIPQPFPPPTSPPLPNPRHEAFAQAVASGQSATDAYVTVYGQGRRDSAANTGSRLRKDPAVAARIAALQSAAAQNVTIDLQKILGFLDRVIFTPIVEVTASSDLCHRKKATAHGDDLAMPDKLAAAALAARLLGFLRAPATLRPPPMPLSAPPSNVLTEEERLILIAQKRAAMEADDGSTDHDDDTNPTIPRTKHNIPRP
jgi:hypothetical protein